MHHNLTKFEISRIVGLRALQIENGAPHLVNIQDDRLRKDCIYVATVELQQGALDFKMNRIYPMNKVSQVNGDSLSFPSEIETIIRTKEYKNNVV